MDTSELKSTLEQATFAEKLILILEKMDVGLFGGLELLRQINASLADPHLRDEDRTLKEMEKGILLKAAIQQMHTADRRDDFSFLDFIHPSGLSPEQVE